VPKLFETTALIRTHHNCGRCRSFTCEGLNSRSGTVMRLNSALQRIEASS